MEGKDQDHRTDNEKYYRNTETTINRSLIL